MILPALRLLGPVVDTASMRRFGLPVALVLAIGLVTASTFVLAQEDKVVFCETYGVLVNFERVGELTMAVGAPASERGQCSSEFGHLMVHGADGWAGVLWDDCIISWREGGRSTAAAEGLECDPQ